MMGGKVAEEMIFNHSTTGASNDIKQATGLVRKIICDYGMTEELGPISYGEKDESIFLGRDFNRHRDYSEKTAETIDSLMRKIIEEQFNRARSILTEHKEELERLAKALLEYEMLDRDDIEKVIKGIVIESPQKTRSIVRTPKEPKESKEPKEQPSNTSADVVNKDVAEKNDNPSSSSKETESLGNEKKEGNA
jgi:cell division protease FtsH